MILDPLMRMDVFVVKTVPVITYRAKDLNEPLLQVPLGRSYQAHIPVFMERTHGSRVKNYRVTSVTKNQHFHLSVEIWGVPFKIFLFHKMNALR